MDPTTIHPPPPPAPAPVANPVPFPDELNEHPQPPIPVQQHNHPSYAEMIYTAIQALKEKNGSSKRAIAKYIEQVYKDQLPPTHDSLLTHHLKRLKSNGMLVMFKKSYKLPRSAPVPDATAEATSAPAVQSSRPRGRPRKAQSQPVQVQPQLVQDANNGQQNAEPVWAALGLSDEPAQSVTSDVVKKRPGRPRKTPPAVAGQLGQPVAQPSTVDQSGGVVPGRRGRGRPPGSRSQKKPSGPPKPGTGTGTKRRPGRPPKNQSQPTPIPFAAPAAAVVAAVPEPLAEQTGQTDVAAPIIPGSTRRRGRPKKFDPAQPSAAVAVVTVGRGRGHGRGRGRGGGGRGGRGRGRGRGRGGLGLPAPPSISTGRPRGRPKGSISAKTSQNAAVADLRKKLEHFQSKVKESLAVLKPHFNHESPVTAIAAIQDLEELGTMDLNAPLREETLPPQEELPPQQAQPPQQQQQLPTQQQIPSQVLPQPPIYQQQFPQYHLQQFHQQQQLQFPPHQQQQPQLYQPPPPQQFHP